MQQQQRWTFAADHAIDHRTGSLDLFGSKSGEQNSIGIAGLRRGRPHPAKRAGGGQGRRAFQQITPFHSRSQFGIAALAIPIAIGLGFMAMLPWASMPALWHLPPLERSQVLSSRVEIGQQDRIDWIKPSAGAGYAPPFSNRGEMFMTRRGFAGVLSIVAILALPLPGLAQKPIELTALDYIEIQQLIAKYARAMDTCSNNGYDYANLYTADGIFLPIINGREITGIQGRERLAEISGGGSNNCVNVGWIEQGVHHIYTNHIITPTAEGASGSVEMLLIGLGGDPNKIEHDGYYEDIYMKTPEGWRFKQRTHHATYDAETRPESASQ
jgi:hypothetical protein